MATVANPAQLLLAQLNAWNNAGVNAADARNPQGDSWAAQRRAVAHLEDIEGLLAEMSMAGTKVDIFSRYFLAWTDAVFAYPTGWTKPGSGEISTVALEHLENLGEFMRNFVPVLEPDGVAKLNEYLTLVSQTLDEDTTLDPLLRQHAKLVVYHLAECLLHYEVVGDFQVQEAVDRLGATLVRVAANSSEENRTTLWRPVMTNFVYPFVVNTISAIPGAVLTMLALGPGTS
jgi:hypothetical protein